MDINELKKNTFEYLLKASLRDKLLILGGSVIVPVVLFVGLYVYPFFEKNEKLDANIKTLSGEVSVLESKQKEIEQIKAENKEMEQILAQAMQLLPQKGQIPEVLSEISNLGNDENLKFMVFKPEAERIVEFYAEIPVTLKIEGQFHNIASFFSKVMMMSRIVNINEYKIIAPARQTGQQVMLTADCKAATYRFLTPEEIKAQEAAKAAAQKK